MSSELRTEVFPATGRITLGAFNFFMLVQTAAAVNVIFARGGTTFGATGVEAGYVKGNVEAWQKGYIDGTAGATVRFFVGEESIAEDFTDYRRTVGVFQQQLGSTLADAADVPIGAGAAIAVAANAARRKVTVKLVSGDSNVRVGSSTITTTRGMQLELGQSYTFEGTGALYAIREGGSAAGLAVLEELY